MNDVLERLYYNEMDTSIEDGGAEQPINDELEKQEQYLLARLKGDELAALQKLLNAQSNLIGLMQVENFKTGFRTAVRLLLAAA